MDSQTESFVFGPLASVLRVSRYLGAAPLRFEKRDNGWQISQSWKYSLYGYCLMTIINLTSMLSITINMLNNNVKDSAVRNMGTIITMVTMSTLVYGAPKRMHCLIVSLNHMQKIKLELNIRHWLPTWTRKQKALFMFWGMCNTLISFLLLQYCFMFEDQDHVGTFTILQAMCAVQFMWTLQLGQLQFLFLALYARSCFTNINDCLRSLLKDNTVPPSSRCQVARGLVSAYARTCRMIRIVDRAYGPTLLLLLSTIFLHLIKTSYFCITMLSIENRGTVLLNQFCWFTHNIFNLAILIEPCHLTQMELEYTRNLVSRLMGTTHSVYDPLTLELEHFNIQLDLNDVSYKPLSFTTLERNLVLTILCCVTKYLVILVDM